MNSSSQAASAPALVALGFTGLEAEVYESLLSSSPATGYGVAQSIRKPLSNVYKALESLQSKGAILVDDGENRVCRAVPVSELLGQLERAFQEKKNFVAEALRGVKGLPSDDRVYQLRSREQVLERCRQMLKECEEVALIDGFPDVLEELRSDVEKTTERGVTVGVMAYSDIAIGGADVFVTLLSEKIVSRWAGEWFCMVVDGSQLLMAFLSLDRSTVHQAIWSSSPFISWVYYSAMAAELSLSRLQAQIKKGVSHEEMMKMDAFKRLWKPEIRGYRNLIERFGSSVR